MFSLRIHNPYETMPGSETYRVRTPDDLLADLTKA